MGRMLIAIGVVLILVGILAQVGVPLGRLPGDIVVKRERGAFYFPIVTCILLSLLFTLLSSALEWLRR